jgi:hypothetical protein
MSEVLLPLKYLGIGILLLLSLYIAARLITLAIMNSIHDFKERREEHAKKNNQEKRKEDIPEPSQVASGAVIDKNQKREEER